MNQPERLETLAEGSEIICDLCIVGSGPAGLSIARAFADSGIRVLLLESGTQQDDARIDALGAIENVGAPRELDQTKVRNRIFGGSTQTWKGRCTSFAAIDFEQREWVPNSGWPIAHSEVRSYMEDAATFMGLGPGVYGSALFDLLGISAPEPALDRDRLDTQFWQFCNNFEFPFGRPPYGPIQMGHAFLNDAAPAVRILIDATVTHLNVNAEGTHLESLDVSSLAGHRVTVRPRATVLCAGGIENARLLLASNRVIATGVGNAHDTVGRYLMDHLRVEVGAFDLADARVIQNRFDFFRVKGPAGHRAYLPGMVLTRELQAREKLLHCASWVEQRAADDDPWPALRSFLRRESDTRLRDLRVVARHAPIVMQGVYQSLWRQRGIRHKAGNLALMCMVEQIPDRESRLELSSRVDALGVPCSRVHWKVNPREIETLARTAQIVADVFADSKLPTPRLAEWVRASSLSDAPVLDVAHPTGTTRMHISARDGVVDTTCKVHGVEGLYIAGSSVFPTAGHANPTQLIVALALRLAEHLKKTVFAARSARAEDRVHVERSEAQGVTASRASTPRVLVTGGTGKIGRHLVAELLRRGLSVRLVTSQAGYTRAGVDVITMNWMESLDFDGVVDGCDAVLHLGAELHDASKMRRVNVDATRALAVAAEAAAVRFFGYASTVSVYGSPTSRIVDETSAVVDDRAIKYLTVPYLQTYAATKLAGERALEAVADRTTYVVFRPTAVVDIDALESMREWGRGNRLRYGARLTNHVYVGDVVAAMIFLMERGVATPRPGAAGVEVFNLADESTFSTYGALYREGFRVTGDARFRPSASLPLALDVLRDAVRYRAIVPPLRYPFGMLRFPPRKLRQAGFRHTEGLDAFYQRSFEHLRDTR